jgi:hypothetical protein
LLTKNCGNGLDRVTTLELLGEWMIGQCLARLLFIVSKGSLEELLKVRGSCLVTHAGSKGERNMGGGRKVGLLGGNDGERVGSGERGFKNEDSRALRRHKRLK